MALTVNVNDSSAVTQSTTVRQVLCVSVFDLSSVNDYGTAQTAFPNTGSIVWGGTGASGSFQAVAQQFTADGTKLASVVLYLEANNTPSDSIQVDIVSSLGGTSLGSKTIAGSTIVSGGETTYAFNFSSPITLTKGSTYYVQITRTGAQDTSNFYIVEAYNVNVYSGGDTYSRTNGTWSADGNIQDYYFQLYYNDANTVVEFYPAVVSDSSAVTENITVKVPIPPISVSDSSAVTESVSVVLVQLVSVSEAPIALDTRTNYIVNPSFEADTAGNGTTPANWNAYNSSGTQTYKGVSTGFSEYGSQSYQITATSNTDTGIYATISGLPLGATVTLSAWVKTDASVANAALVLTTNQHGLNGNAQNENNIGANNNSRQSVSVVLDITSVNVWIALGSFGAQSTGTAYFDGIMLEVSPNSNSYIDGSQANCVWTGTANASTSTTTLGLLDVLDIYMPSVSDSSTVTDSLSTLVISYDTISDSSAVTDSSTVELVDLVSVNDSSAVTDSVALQVPVNASVSDSSAVTETIALLLTNFVSVFDSTTATDTPTVVIPMLPISVEEDSAVTESVTIALAPNITVSESSAVTEQIALLLSSFLGVSDSSTVTDSVSLNVPVNATVSDSSTVTDSVTLKLTSFVSVFDSSAVTDSLSLKVPVNIFAQENTIATDVLPGTTPIYFNPIDIVVFDTAFKNANIAIVDGRIALKVTDGAIPNYIFL